MIYLAISCTQPKFQWTSRWQQSQLLGDNVSLWHSPYIRVKGANIITVKKKKKNKTPKSVISAHIRAETQSIKSHDLMCPSMKMCEWMKIEIG